MAEGLEGERFCWHIKRKSLYALPCEQSLAIQETVLWPAVHHFTAEG